MSLLLMSFLLLIIVLFIVLFILIELSILYIFLPYFGFKDLNFRNFFSKFFLEIDFNNLLKE